MCMRVGLEGNEQSRTERMRVEGDADRPARMLAARVASGAWGRSRATQEEKQRERNREKETNRGETNRIKIQQGLEKERRERKGKERTADAQSVNS